MDPTSLNILFALSSLTFISYGTLIKRRVKYNFLFIDFVYLIFFSINKKK